MNATIPVVLLTYPKKVGLRQVASKRGAVEVQAIAYGDAIPQGAVVIRYQRDTKDYSRRNHTPYYVGKRRFGSLEAAINAVLDAREDEAAENSEGRNAGRRLDERDRNA
jgi:hypothetical protein